MAQPIVAISTVENGNMYIPSDVANNDVLNNRTQWLESLGMELNDTTRLAISYTQPDFCRYQIVNEHQKGDSVLADALVTSTPGHALFLPVADCVATVFYDEEHSVLMLAHLGRHSLEQQGGVKSVEFLTKHFATEPASLKVWLSPAPSKKAYPIYALENKGMKEALYEQLLRSGIAMKNINDNSAETDVDPMYYSHSAFLRGDKPNDGRFAMVAMIPAK